MAAIDARVGLGGSGCGRLDTKLCRLGEGGLLKTSLASSLSVFVAETSSSAVFVVHAVPMLNNRIIKERDSDGFLL
jgi:hypothetical protein